MIKCSTQTITIFISILLALPACAKVTVLIGFKDKADPIKLNLPAQFSLTSSKTPKLLIARGIKVSPTDYPYSINCESKKEALHLLQILKSNPLVQYAEISTTGKVKGLNPNDPQLFFQWHHPIIATPDAWETTTGSPNITVAIIDTGINANLTEFNNRIVPGYDFANDDNDPSDDSGHGTRVAAIGFASGNNGFGTAGIDWQCRIMPIKVADASGALNDLDVADGINFAVSNGANVINLSLGLNGVSQTMTNAINNAIDNGCIVIAAASSGNQDGLSFPASLPQVIAVGATDSNELKHDTSGVSSALDLVAPGKSVWTTNANGSITSRSGTSYSTPIVSGTATLLLALDPSLTQSQVENILRASADDQVGNAADTLGFDTTYGHGRLNVHSAVLLLGGIIQGPTVSFATGSNFPTLTWKAPANTTNKKPYTFEYSNDLKLWTSFSSHPSLNALTNGTVSYTDNGSLTAPLGTSRFYRYKITP